MIKVFSQFIKRELEKFWRIYIYFDIYVYIYNMYISGSVYKLIRIIYNLLKSFNCFRHYSRLFIPYFMQASMDLPPDKAKLLRNYDDEKKWDMICDQVSKMNYITHESKTVRGTHFLSFSLALSVFVFIFIVGVRHFLFMANANFAD